MMLLNATYSENLGLAASKLCEGKDLADAIDIINDRTDLTSTAGFDNDGSTGPEMIDNGIKLGLAAAKLDKKIFWAIWCPSVPFPPTTVAFFVLAEDEDEAVRLLTPKLA
jgi:hypothetical protein